MADFFYRLGRLAGPAVRKGRWIWHTLVGTEGDEIAAELAVGRDLAAAMEAELGTDRDEALAAYVSEIGKGLVERVRDQRRSFRFGIVQGRDPNAFALPGGFVYVTRPLLDLCGQDRDEIAFVLGHEMGHVIRKHAINRVIQSSAIGLVAKAAPAAGGALAAWVRRSGVRLLESAYSRADEHDADSLGVRLARAAGHDPDASIQLLQRLHAAHEGPEPPPWLSTHPPVRERVARIRETLRESRADESSDPKAT